jgi:plasmid maintenance system antidote protein VapI
MSVRLDPDLLRYELAIRGISAFDLAKLAHLSPATVSAALAGRPIAEASARQIDKVLKATPPSEFLKRLIPPPPTGPA